MYSRRRYGPYLRGRSGGYGRYAQAGLLRSRYYVRFLCGGNFASFDLDIVCNSVYRYMGNGRSLVDFIYRNIILMSVYFQCVIFHCSDYVYFLRSGIEVSPYIFELHGE